MKNILIITILLPLLFAGLCAATRNKRVMESLNAFGALVSFVLALVLAGDVIEMGTISELDGNLYADALSALVVIVVTLVSFAASVYSISYMSKELKHSKIDENGLRRYYPLFQLFVFTMLLVALSSSIGVMWIAIEATTIVSALLVGMYNNKNALEAAWKYLFICSVGIAFALLGNILLYATSVNVVEEPARALDWAALMEASKKLDPSLVKLSYVFILIGYGTKAGIAPMHNWLPDAHSEAPTPVSALLSGVLLKCAIYGMFRIHLIAVGCIGVAFPSYMLVIFGLFSIGIATGFILIQKDIKRLLAYHSVEHVGIIVLGIGIGGPLGIFGAMFHMLNHAVTKALMFFASGNLAQRYKTKDMGEIKGALKAMPLTASILLLGTFALAGMPPFSIFVSEFSILSAGISSGAYIPIALFLIFLAIILGGLVHHIGDVSFGEKTKNEGETFDWTMLAMFGLAIIVVSLGLFMPSGLRELLERIAEIAHSAQR